MSDPAALLRDLIQNLNRIPPEQLHLLEPALVRLTQQVQRQAEAQRHTRLRPTPFEVALDWLCDMRIAICQHDAKSASNAADRAMQLLRWDALVGS